MMQAYFNRIGGNCFASARLFTIRNYCDNGNNKLTYQRYKNECINESSEGSSLSYQKLDNRALKKMRQKEYLQQVEAETYNSMLKNARETPLDSYFSSSFTAFMRSRRYFKSPWHRVTTIAREQFRETVGTIDLFPTLKLDNNGSLIKEKRTPFEMNTDIVVIGGGMVGVSIAYHIKRLLENDIKVTIVDKDFSYGHSATNLSLGGLKQQFSLAENIQLSKYAASFLDNAKEELSYDGHVPDIGFNYSGFLTLAGKEKIKELEKNFSFLSKNDVEAKLLYKEELKSYFPWMNGDDIEAGILGLEQEGWFDHVSLLQALHRKCSYLGTDYVVGEFVDSDLDQLESKVAIHLHDGRATRVTSVKIKLPSGPTVSIPCGILVLAAGINTPHIGKILEIGEVSDEESVFGQLLPILKKRHFVYKIHVQKGLGLNCPIIMDPNGIIFRRDGLANIYICQTSPPPDIDDDNTSIENYFMEFVCPALQKVSKSFEDCKILKSYITHSDYNNFDRNPIIGFHRGVTNLFIASGFNSNSVNALGVGNYFMEKVLSQEHCIDLGKYTPDRVLSTEDEDTDYRLIDNWVH